MLNLEICKDQKFEILNSKILLKNGTNLVLIFKKKMQIIDSGSYEDLNIYDIADV